MKLDQNSSHYFLVFIVIGALALSMIPVLKKSFAATSDTLIIETLKKVQAEMFFTAISDNFFQECIRGSVVLDGYDLLFETGKAISCQVSNNYNSMAVSSVLSDNLTYCVDSEGASIEASSGIENGRCLK